MVACGRRGAGRNYGCAAAFARLQRLRHAKERFSPNGAAMGGAMRNGAGSSFNGNPRRSSSSERTIPSHDCHVCNFLRLTSTELEYHLFIMQRKRAGKIKLKES